MARILGLDLGTNSIGWAIVEEENKNFLLVDKGVRIFSEGVKIEKGIESSRASERTAYRSARKIKFRRKLRKYETLKVLSAHGMCPLSLEEIEEWRTSGFKKYPLNPEFLKWLRTDDDHNINPYTFRDLASKKKISLFDLGRALYHIAQRRGFLSNRLDQTGEGILEQHSPYLQNIVDDAQNVEDLFKEIQEYFSNTGILDETVKDGFKKDLDEGEKKLKSLYKSLATICTKNTSSLEISKEELTKRLNKKEELGAVKQEIGEISQAMKDGNFTTLGQYFHSLYSKDRIRDKYTAREEHYLKEFEIICKVQNLDGITESEQLPEKRYFGLAKQLFKAIFYQRPLKSQKGLIGKCVFEKSKSRCAVSHPDFEEYRMWTYLNTIKIGSQEEQEMRFLTPDEKQRLIEKFYRKKEHFNFEDLAKEITQKGAKIGFYKSSRKIENHYWFNYKPTDTVAGCPVSASFKSIFGNNWKFDQYSFDTLDTDGNIITKTLDYRDLWHLLYVSNTDVYLYEYAKEKLGLSDKQSKSFSSIRLKKDFSNLSLNAINKILPFLKTGLLYSHAVFMANIKQLVDPELWNENNTKNDIQDGIASIIENHIYENNLLEAVNGLIKNCKTENAYYSREAEPLYRKDLENRLETTFRKYNIQNKEEVLEHLFPQFISHLKAQSFATIKRIDEKVLDFLCGENTNGQIYCTDTSRFKKLYHPSDVEVFKKVIVKDGNGNEKLVLGSPLTSSIKNPMAMRALHQLRKVLNTLMLEGQIDERTKVHIEMARELNDANKRKGIQDYQEGLRKARLENIKNIKELYLKETNTNIEPTEDDILRFQLWLEQNMEEIYEEGKKISISDIIGKNPKYDIEHTIPKSISQDNSQMNKTLCSQKFNRSIKKNKMPVELDNYEEILPRVKHWQKEAEKLSYEIEMISRSIKTAATKEIKDKKIRRRHYLTLKRDYIKGKYERFVWQEPKVGFKNSQIPDTGIITKYAQAYLKSYFKRVDSVKGGMVAEFRKIWGIQDYVIEDGKINYEKKNRDSHTHHSIDALVIACMTKEKYDILAHAWTLEDRDQLQEARKILSDSKPWKTFTEDIKKIESEIMISHYKSDRLKTQSKKIVRVRGKKQYVAEISTDANGKKSVIKDAEGKTKFILDGNGKKIPRYHQGDTIRGSLHLDSIYGAIKDVENGNKVRYVIRKNLESLGAKELENIVDPVVREKVRVAVEQKILVFAASAQQKNKFTDNQQVWMNKEKGIAINKVRVYADSIKNPLEIKAHTTLSKSKHLHKQMIYGSNDENYAMALYELDGKRDFELINNFNLAKLMKQGQGDYPLYKEKEIKGKTVIYPIAKSNGRDVILKKGLQVIFYDKSVENPKDISEITDLTGRQYIIEGLSIQRIPSAQGKISEYGVLMFRENKEARKADEIKKDNFKSDGIFRSNEIKPTRKMNHNQFSGFVEGIDFKILPTGKLETL